MSMVKCLFYWIEGKKSFKGKLFSMAIVLFCPIPTPLQGAIYITKLAKKFFPGLIITFKIEAGNQWLVTEDYRLFF